jgi:hypothetical protein
MGRTACNGESSALACIVVTCDRMREPHPDYERLADGHRSTSDTWDVFGRALEPRLKRWHMTTQFCPRCRQRRGGRALPAAGRPDTPPDLPSVDDPRPPYMRPDRDRRAAQAGASARSAPGAIRSPS